MFAAHILEFGADASLRRQRRRRLLLQLYHAGTNTAAKRQNVGQAAAIFFCKWVLGSASIEHPKQQLASCIVIPTALLAKNL